MARVYGVPTAIERFSPLDPVKDQDCPSLTVKRDVASHLDAVMAPPPSLKAEDVGLSPRIMVSGVSG